jgi:RNA polymerase sigma factor (sigma-70 family)
MTSLDSFEKKLDKFRSNNPELIEAYESKTGDSFDDYTHDLYQMYVSLAKLRPTVDPIATIQSSLCEAIHNNISVLDAFDSIIARAMMGGDDHSTLQQYFKELGRVYDKHDNNYDIVYCPENRDKLIEMNLKTVISIAKGYQGLGLSLEELISAGNLGLVTSFDKYDPDRAKLKDNMLACLEDLPDDADQVTILGRVYEYMKYGDIKKKFIKTFGITEKVKVEKTEESEVDELEEIIGKSKSKSEPKLIGWKEFTKNDVSKWIKKTVQNATFNSVAFMWIRAFILIEIDTNSRLVKKPKSEIYNDKLKYGSYKKEVTLDIDAPVNDDGNTNFGDILQIEDDTPTVMDVSEAYDTFKEGLNKLLDGVKPRDRSVFLKKFGIGLPRPMLPKEIAEQENLSIARISQIFQSVIEQMQYNASKYNINPNVLFEAARSLD